jgi:hypothetical protein
MVLEGAKINICVGWQNNICIFAAQRYRGREARQRSAKPFTAVRICSVPPIMDAAGHEVAGRNRLFDLLTTVG